MDMKKILQAMDGVASKPVEGANDMKKFVSIINEGSNPHKVSLPVQMAMQHYQQTEPAQIEKKKYVKDGIRKFFREVETQTAEQIAAEQSQKRQLINQYAQVIAERVLMKEGKETARDKWSKASAEREKKHAEHEKEISKLPVEKRSGAAIDALEKHLKDVKENEIPDHTIGFTPGPGGPGMQSNVPDGGHLGLGEAPLDFDKENPTASTIYGHKSNPGSIEYRIMRARAQLKDLAQQADSNELIVWESIARHFPELAMNIEEIRHGIEELAKIRKGGGRRVHNIPKDISESNPIKEANAKKKTLKNSNPCWTGYKPVGTKKKGGRTVPNCVPKE
jgi:hypothetical protein